MNRLMLVIILLFLASCGPVEQCWQVAGKDVINPKGFEEYRIWYFVDHETIVSKHLSKPEWNVVEPGLMDICTDGDVWYLREHLVVEVE